MEPYRPIISDNIGDIAETVRDIVRKRQDDVDLDDAQKRTGYSNIVMPSVAFNPVGSVSDPDYDGTNGAWLFDATSTDLLFFAFKFPDGYIEGSNFQIHVYWQKTTSTSGNVLWQIDYKEIKIGEIMPSSFTTIQTNTVNPLVTDDNTADRNLVSSFDEINGDQYKTTSGMIMKISRIGGDALDTYGNDARLLGIVVSCEIDTYKTRSMFQK